MEVIVVKFFFNTVTKYNANVLLITLSSIGEELTFFLPIDD